MRIQSRCRRLACLVLLSGLAACSGVPTKSFTIDAIDDQRNDIKCLVIIDDVWPTEEAAANYTPTTVTVSFPRPQVSIRVFPARIGSDGKPVRIPQSNDTTDFRSERREVEIRDPKRQLFILPPSRR